MAKYGSNASSFKPALPAFPAARCIPYCYCDETYYPYGNSPMADFLCYYDWKETGSEQVNPSILSLGCGDIRFCVATLVKYFYLGCSTKLEGIKFYLNDRCDSIDATQGIRSCMIMQWIFARIMHESCILSCMCVHDFRTFTCMNLMCLNHASSVHECSMYIMHEFQTFSCIIQLHVIRLLYLFLKLYICHSSSRSPLSCTVIYRFIIFTCLHLQVVAVLLLFPPLY